MSPPPAKPAEEEPVDEYEGNSEEEADDYNEEDDNSGVEDGDEYQDEDGVDDGEDDDEEGPRKDKSLTGLLLADHADGEQDGDDEDDGAYVPGGGVEPAEEVVDGDKHELSPRGAEEVASLVNPQIPGVSAIGIKRKTSGDEEDAEEDATEETEAKRAKAGGDE